MMAPVLKTGIPERVSGVRIPPSPPDFLRFYFQPGDHQTERPSSDAVMTSALLRITSPNLFGPTIREFRPIDDDRAKPEPVPRLSARGFRPGSPFLRRLRSHATCIFQDPSRTSTRPYLLALSPFRLAKPRTGNARSCKATEKITRAGIDIS